MRRWVRAPRVHGRLTAKELGLVINEDDPYSVQIGAYYAKARQIPASRILKVRLPVKPTLTPGEFAAFSKEVEAFFGQRVQGLALSWRQPFAVNCNSITGALALGYDHRLCQNTCSTSRASTYFGGISTRPHADHGMRLSMLLAASDVRSAKAMIDRGVRSDHTLGLRGAPPAQVHYVSTSDRIRSQRRLLFPGGGTAHGPAVGHGADFGRAAGGCAHHAVVCRSGMAGQRSWQELNPPGVGGAARARF